MSDHASGPPLPPVGIVVAGGSLLEGTVLRPSQRHAALGAFRQVLGAEPVSHEGFGGKEKRLNRSFNRRLSAQPTIQMLYDSLER